MIAARLQFPFDPPVRGQSGATLRIKIILLVTFACLGAAASTVSGAAAGDTAKISRAESSPVLAGELQPSTSLPRTEPVRETRLLRVVAIKPTQPDYSKLDNNLPGSGSLQLASLTGAGTLTRLQIAVANGRHKAAVDSMLNVAVDGRTVMSVPLGLFYLLNGEAAEFNSDNLTVARNTSKATAEDGPNCNVGAWRNISIPFSSSLVITLTNADASPALVFSQVEYYAGAAPAGLYDPRRAVFHSAVIPFTSVAPLASIDALPLVALDTLTTGVLDSVQMVTFTTDTGTHFSSLEGHPSIIADGEAFTYLGTEDFFGGNYYFFKPIYTAEVGGSYTAGFAGGTANGARGYRFFNRTPLLFNRSLRITFTNGSANEGPNVAPIASFEFLVIYYTSS